MKQNKKDEKGRKISDSSGLKKEAENSGKAGQAAKGLEGSKTAKKQAISGTGKGKVQAKGQKGQNQAKKQGKSDISGTGKGAKTGKSGKVLRKSKSTGKAGRDEKGQFLPGNKEGNRFEKGNKDAEKWTRETVVPILQKMLKRLTKRDDDEEEDDNIVRANDIKLAGEIRLMHGVTKQRWNEWEKKFKDDPEVSDLLETITEILECRLIYSGTSMDTFVLKNHFDYTDKMDTTSGGKELGSSFLDFLKQTSAIPPSQ